VLSHVKSNVICASLANVRPLEGLTHIMQEAQGALSRSPEKHI